MNTYRNQYLYLPRARFLQRLSPAIQLASVVVKTVLLLTIVAIELAQLNSMI